VTQCTPLHIDLQLNRVVYARTIDPRVSPLDALRDHLGLTGTKKGCNHGACGRLHRASQRRAH
jgi:xanthine dehydrogenase YagT iron-sulfur-binding subunit